ncbi:MAG TPA: VOC family protein [Candidatus Dormibacteraeota bacterium]|jgi:catechol 2,3-dioxygenase-like lactoylglutathione lyase family enzyme
MNTQINAVVIGVKDIKRAKEFYAQGLGCQVAQDTPAFVSFDMGGGSSSLALYTWDALAKDAGVAADGSGFRGVTLNHFVESTQKVDEVLAKAKDAGGEVVRPGQQAQWGGYFGYFSDPDGYLWKVVASSER